MNLCKGPHIALASLTVLLAATVPAIGASKQNSDATVIIEDSFVTIIGSGGSYWSATTDPWLNNTSGGTGGLPSAGSGGVTTNNSLGVNQLASAAALKKKLDCLKQNAAMMGGINPLSLPSALNSMNNPITTLPPIDPRSLTTPA